MRIEYKCYCDRCKEQIHYINDENDVTLNSRKLVFCPPCYEEICSFVDKLLKV